MNRNELLLNEMIHPMGATSFRHCGLGWILALTVCLLLSWQVHKAISGDSLQYDARENLIMAHNVYVNGVFSQAWQAPFEPSDYREPLPPLVTALYMAIEPTIHRRMPLASFFEGENTRLVKQVNVLWVLFGLIGSWVLTYLACRSHLVALLAVLGGYLFFFGAGKFMDRLYTEIPAASLMVWAAAALVWLTRSGRLWVAALSGLLFGMLALTKAMFLYVFVLVALLLSMFHAFVLRDLRLSERWVPPALLCLVFVMVVFPWMVRNKLLLDRFEISERGGVVLLVRAFKNEMTSDEMVGAYWRWGPLLYRRLVEGSALDASEADFASGGRFQRLNRSTIAGDLEAQAAGRPEDAISFYQQVWAWRTKFVQQAEARGEQNQNNVADFLLQRRAFQMIADAPATHLAMGPLFMWRGIWCFPQIHIPYIAERYQRYVIDSVNAAAYLSLFWVFVFALVRRRYDLAAMTVVPVAILAFYVLLSHNIPRYSAPCIPIMVISFLVIVFGKLGRR